MQPIINTMLDPVVNFGKVTVSTGYSSGDTSIVLNTGDGSKLPDPSLDGSFNLVWFNSSTYASSSDDPNVEIVRCIARVGDTLIITRGQEGTLASNKNTPTKIYKMILSLTRKTITDIRTEYESGVSVHSALSTGVHGVGGSTVESATGSASKVSTHAAIASSVHGFDSLGDAPAQTHGISRHSGTIGDHVANLSSIGTNTHAQIDTALTASTGHIAATTGVHGVGVSTVESTAGSQAKVDTHSSLSTGVHGVGGSTVESTTGSASKVGTHAAVSTSVHNFDSLGDAPAQAHGISRHSGNIGTEANITFATTSGHAHTGVDSTKVDHTNLLNIGSNTHAQIDTAVTASAGHIAANGTSVHGLGTMSTQNANNVAITGGSITGVTGISGGWTLITKAYVDSPFTAASDNTILCNAAGGNMTINLPAAASNANKVYNIKKIDSSGNSITIDASASETIDGTLTKSLNTQYESITVQCDSANWYII